MEISLKSLLMALLMWMLALLPGSAQQDVMRQINDIKSRAAAEGILTVQLMVDEPNDSVLAQCSEGILTQLGGGYTLADVKPHLKQLTMKRGQRQLLFVYLRCSDLGSPTASPSPTSPVTNTPSPVTLHPSPVTNTPSPVTLHPSPVTNTPSPVTNNSSPFTLHHSPFTVNLLSPLLQLSDGKAVVQQLERLKALGHIDGYGPISKAVGVDSLFVLLLNADSPYAPYGLLTPKTGGRRTNLKTGADDEVDQHRGSGALWIKVAAPSKTQ